MKIHLISESSCPEWAVDATKKAVEIVTEIARLNIDITIFDQRNGRDHNLGNLIKENWSEERAQLDGGTILRGFHNHLGGNSNHLIIATVNEDLYDDDCGFCIAMAIKGTGLIVSARRFKDIPTRIAIQETVAIHEVGHVFGAPDRSHRDDLEYSLGNHCTKEDCVMQQGLRVPSDFIRIDKNWRKAGRPFCPECLQDIRRYGRKLSS